MAVPDFPILGSGLFSRGFTPFHWYDSRLGDHYRAHGAKAAAEASSGIVRASSAIPLRVLQWGPVQPTFDND
jgi:hypothetical protein